jgi:hypothetical protein
MAEDNYAIAAATQLRDIGFAEFTSDLIGKTFDAIIDANLKQTESYIDLVKEMTKSLSAYINDTKLEISNQEVLYHLGSLPKFVNDSGAPIVNQAITSNPPPVALVPDEAVRSIDLTAINKNFTSGQLVSTILQAAGNPAITSLVKDSLGEVRKLVGQVSNSPVFPLLNQPDYYEPTAFTTFLTTGTTLPTTVTLNEVSIAKLYDSVAEVIAGDKYALLQEMVKLGVLRLVVTEGIIKTSLTFSTWERSSKSSSSYDKHSEHMKNSSIQIQQRPSHGIFKSIRGRPLEKNKSKERTLHVQTASEQSSSSQGTTISIFGGVEIRFKTDYQPVAQA